MVFRAVLALTLLISATVEAKDVSVWMDKVKLTCPWSGKLYQVKGSSSESLLDGTSTTKYTEYTYNYTGTTDQYRCEKEDDETIKYHFYIQGKPCKNCIELDAWVFAVVIVADVIGTTVVMVLVHKCSKKTTGAQQKTPKAPRSREVDIPLTYETLNPHTRSQETYSTVINKTG